MQHRLLQQRHIAMNSRFHRHLLHAHAGRASGGAGQRQIANHGHVDAVPVDITGDLHNAAIGQVADVAEVRHIEVAAIDAPGLQPFNDV